MAITNKRKTVGFIYRVNGQSIAWNNHVKYLGLLVDSKLSWSKHCKYVVKKATKSLYYLRCSMYGCSHAAKCVAYKAIVCPLLEYAAVVCCPHTSGDIKLLESPHNRAAQWICGSHWSPPTNSWTIPSSDCCSQLSLPILQTRRQFLSISFLHDIYHQRTSINFNRHFKFITVLSTMYHLSLVNNQFSSLSVLYQYCLSVEFHAIMHSQ